MCQSEKKRYRNIRLDVRLFEEENAILEQKARAKGVNKSDYICDLIFDSEVTTGNKQILQDENFKKLLYELNRIGNNINQIAYNSNLKRSTGREEIEALVVDYETLSALYLEAFLLPDDEETENGDSENGYDKES